MSSILSIRLWRFSLISVLCSGLIAACSGGGGSDGAGALLLPTSPGGGTTAPAPGVGSGTTPPVVGGGTPTDTPKVPGEGAPPSIPVLPPPGTGTPGPTEPTATCSVAIDKAMVSGDATGLTAEPIADCAYKRAVSQATTSDAILGAIYKGVSSQYDSGEQSQLINPVSLENGFPLVVGDAGRNLASISVANNGRGAAYNLNLLEQFGGGGNLAHVPAFKRVLGWLVSGDASKALPAALKIGWYGLNMPNGTKGLTTAGVSGVTSVACDFMADAGCVQGLQLLVVGAQMAASPALEARVRELMGVGIPVLYIHTRAWNNEDVSGQQVLAAMQLAFGDYSGNFFTPDAVAAGRSESVNLQKLNPLTRLLPFFEKLAKGSWRTDYAWGNCAKGACADILRPDVLDPADQIRTSINAYNGGGRNLFTAPGTTLERYAALWADVIRTQIRYPMDKAADSARFQQAAVADRWVAYVRPVSVRQTDLGTYMGQSVDGVVASTSAETISVRLSDASGYTAIGRFALPGQVVSVQVLDAAGATGLGVQLNTLREGATRLWETKRYDRPNFLRSPALSLASPSGGAAGTALQFNSPYGGMLQLSFSGATPGAVVKLSLRGTAKQPFIDMTQGNDVAAFMANFNAPNVLDWAELKLGPVEIHTKVEKMKSAIQNAPYAGNLPLYMDEMLKYFLGTAQDLAAFAVPGRTLSASVVASCSEYQWDCTDSTIHQPPGVQHINADTYASCGAGCSGNPYDVSWGVVPRGWGESHEFGHNLQTEMLKIYGDASTEVPNNIFPLYKNWRIFQVDPSAPTDRAEAIYTAFGQLLQARQAADPVQAAYDIVWKDASYAANDQGRLAFYVQWVLYWEHQTGDPQRGWDLYKLLYLHKRLFAQGDWATQKAALGYGTYAERPKENGNDNMLIMLSYLTKKDQRPTFDLWGIRYSTAAAAQVTAYGFAKEPAFFYANNQMTDHRSAKRLDMSTSLTPAWPFPK